MRRMICAVLLAGTAAGALAGCRGSEAPNREKESCLFYTNVDGTELACVDYELPGEDVAGTEAVETILEDMRKPEDESEYASALPGDVKVSVSNVSAGKADLEFSEEYLRLPKSREVLLRAAVVQSVVQLEEVGRVKFYIEGEPLKKKDGTEVGYMQADDFVQNAGSAVSSYQKAKIKLYFADSSGEKLVGEKREVRYNSSKAIEQVIVERLIKGPKEEAGQETIPEGTSLLGVSVKDRVCYVNLNEGFLAQPYMLPAETIVYSIVNSLTELNDIDAVQISVEGKTDVKFQDVLDLSSPLRRKTEIMEETK